MRERLKALGLALVSVLAIGAAVASVPAAHAESQGVFFGSEIGTENHVTTFVRGTQKATDPIEFTAGEQVVACSEGEISTQISGGTAKQFPFGLNFKGNCSAGGFPATVSPNECTLSLETTETVASHSFTGQAGLICPDGVPGVVLRIYFNAAHTFLFCTMTIPPQGGLKGATVHNSTNEGADDLEVTLNSSVTRTQTGVCGHQHSTATIHGSATATGENEAGEPVDIWIGHE